MAKQRISDFIATRVKLALVSREVALVERAARASPPRWDPEEFTIRGSALAGKQHLPLLILDYPQSPLLTLAYPCLAPSIWQDDKDVTHDSLLLHCPVLTYPRTLFLPLSTVPLSPLPLSGGEVTAIFSRDETKIELKIRLPPTYPLCNVEVECAGKSGLKDASTSTTNIFSPP